MASTPFVQPEVDVARGLHHPLALHDSLAGLAVAALRQVVLEHRRGRLLDLQEQRVLLIATLEQHDERPRADAADADDLAGDVDDFEALEQVAPIVLQRRSVGAELLVDRVLRARRRRCRCSGPGHAAGTTIGGWLTIRY